NMYKNKALQENTWIQEILPFQIITIGELAILTLPFEPSTIAGQRIRKSVTTILEKKGIKHIVISPYANSYVGYITTPEEYDVQRYEGGHTLFGRNTLPAIQTIFKNLSIQIVKDKKS